MLNAASSYLIPGLAAVLTLVFVGAAVSKLAGKQVASYRRWGLPLAFMYALAVVELAGAALLWVPRFRLLAVGGLALLMVGAVLVLLRHRMPAAHVRVPLLVLALLLGLGYLVWPPASPLLFSISR
ncbi:hypothetical protein GCM10027422_45740 [Hymenobacter arcticus]